MTGRKVAGGLQITRAFVVEWLANGIYGLYVPAGCLSR